MPGGSYKVYYTNATGCVSEPIFFCVTGNGGSALAGTTITPSITSPSNGLTAGTTTITGTGEPNSSVSLFINGLSVQTVTASAAGAFTFTNLSLLNGQQVYITNVLSTGTVSSSKCQSSTATLTVSCYTSAPIITTDANGQIISGQPLTGIASEPAGTIIRVYTSPSTLVATTTVQSNGTWSTADAGTTPSVYNVVAGTTYFATAQNGTCGTSVNSGTATAAALTTGRCGTITGPVGAGVTSVSGTLIGSFTTTTVNFYLDGINIGAVTTTGTTWGPIAVNTTANNALYANGVLTIGVQESGKTELPCASSASTISCSSSPAEPTISPNSTTINQNGTVTYMVANAVAGSYYGIADAVTGASFGDGLWAPTTGSVTITTKPFTQTGTYSLAIKATALSGVDVCNSTKASASVIVTGVLPLQAIDLTGKLVQDGVLLQWITEGEINIGAYEIERSKDGIFFTKIAEKSPIGTSNRTTYTYIDQMPVSGITYYRIKVVDVDGKYVYSKLIRLTDDATGFTLNSIKPNPFMSELSINITLPKHQPIQVLLIDENGRQVYKQKYEGRNGINTITLAYLKQLSNGFYIVRLITAEGTMLQQKVIKGDH